MIHEGTHGIQALDLLGRKVVMDDGARPGSCWLRTIDATIERARAAAGAAPSTPTRWPARSQQLGAATTRGLGDRRPEEALANATPYLQAFGHVVLAWIWLDVAICAAARRPTTRRSAAGSPPAATSSTTSCRRSAPGSASSSARRHLPDDGRGLVLKLAAGRIETLVWVLIYGGLLVFGLGVALSRGGLDYGWSVSVVGIVIAVAGVVLIYVRSRMSDRADA